MAGFWCHMSLDYDLGGRSNIETNWLEDSVRFGGLGGGGGLEFHTDANVCDERCMDGDLSPSSSDSRAPCKRAKLHMYSILKITAMDRKLCLCDNIYVFQQQRGGLL